MSYARNTSGQSFYLNPSLMYGPMLPGQYRYAPVPGWGMNPYWAGPRMVAVGGYGDDNVVGADCLSRGMCGTAPNCVPCAQRQQLPSWVAPVAIGGIFLLMGFAVYAQYKIGSKIAEKEGTAGMLKYELGSAAIGLGRRAGEHAIDRSFSKNRSRRRRARRA